MLLCLSNGERIKLHNKMRIIFEVSELSQASPATISRCGIVYVNDTILHFNNLITSYFLKVSLPPQVVNYFLKELNAYLPSIFKFLD